MNQPALSVQRFALGLDSEGNPKLLYDMRGEVVRFGDHQRALTAEREVAIQKPQAEAAPGEEAPPTSSEIHAARRGLYDAVKVLRRHGLSDGDIVFAAELDPEEPITFVPGASQPDTPTEEGDQPDEHGVTENDRVVVEDLAESYGFETHRPPGCICDPDVTRSTCPAHGKGNAPALDQTLPGPSRTKALRIPYTGHVDACGCCGAPVTAVGALCEDCEKADGRPCTEQDAS